MTVRFLKFCLVGFSGVFVNMAVFSLLDQKGFYYVLAAVIAFLAAVSNNFFWNNSWTFKDRCGEKSSLKGRYASFFVISAACLLGNLFILVLLVEKCEWPHQMAQITSILVMSVANFFGQNIITFGAKKE